MTEKEIKLPHQGLNILIRRTTKRFTLEQLSEKVGISKQRLSEIEKLDIIDDAILDRIAKGLDTDINWFKNYDPINEVDTYIDHSTNTSTASENAQQNNMTGGNNTTVNYPIDEGIKLIDRALALQKELHEKEILLLKDNFELRLKIALLEQEKELMNRK